MRPEWHFENRTVDLIAEGYDAAIGGGFELSPGVVSRTLAPANIVAVAAPAYLAGWAAPQDPSHLKVLDGIVMRTGRNWRWTMRDADAREMAAEQPQTLVLNEPAAKREAALLRAVRPGPSHGAAEWRVVVRETSTAHNTVAGTAG